MLPPTVSRLKFYKRTVDKSTYHLQPDHPTREPRRRHRKPAHEAADAAPVPAGPAAFDRLGGSEDGEGAGPAEGVGCVEGLEAGGAEGGGGVGGMGLVGGKDGGLLGWGLVVGVAGRE